MRNRGAPLLAALVVAALLAAGGALAVMRRETTYRSHAFLLIDNPVGIAAAGDDGLVNKLNSLREKYVTLGHTSTILGPAAERLGVTAGALAGATTVQSSPASLLLVATATTADGERSRAYAQVVADQLVSYVDAEMEEAGVEPARRITLRVVEPARTGDEIGPSARRAALVATVLGAVGAAAGWWLGLAVRPLRRASGAVRPAPARPTR